MYIDTSLVVPYYFGRALGTRPRTVAKHVGRIYRKLGVESRAAATARAHAASAARLAD